MKLNNPSLLWQSAFSIIARFAGVGLNFAVAIVITRTLPMNEAGMLFMLMTLVTGISLFSRVGVEQWLVREVAGLPEDGLAQAQLRYLHSAFRLLLFTSLVFMAIWLFLSPVIKRTLFDGDIQLSLLWTAVLGIFFFNLVMTNSAFMKAAHHISESLLIQNALPAVCMMLAILLFWPWFPVNQNYLWIYTLSLALAGIASFYWLRAWLPSVKTREQPLPRQEVFQSAIPLAPVSYFAFMMLWADTLMTGWLLTNEDVALFTVAARLSFVSGFFLGALDATIYPRLLRIHKQNPEKLRKFFWQATLLVAGVLTVVTLIIAAVGKPVLAVFNEGYVQAATTLIILLLGQLVRGLGITFSFMFIIREQVRYLNILLFVALLANLLANWLLIPQYGIEGAAMATLAANLLLTGGVIVFFFKNRLLSGYA
ncbi:MAG: oligosaccharide flippase family protein [Thiolinea sp.]